MDRRSFVKAAGGALGAAVGALTAKRGIGLPGAEQGVAGQQMGANATLSAMPFSGANWPAGTNWASEMTLVSGPDPGTYAHIRFDEAENATVVPPGMETPSEMARAWAIPRTLFPEYDPAHGTVPLPMFRWSHSGDDDLALLRASYQHALGQRHPDRPLDGNHLSIRFMPRALMDVYPMLNGELAPHVNESYDGPNGWVVQLVTDKDGKVVMWGDSLRYRLVTGNVQHWVDGAPVKPGTYTAPLLP